MAATTSRSADTATAVDILIDSVRELKTSVDNLSKEISEMKQDLAVFKEKCIAFEKQIAEHERRLNDDEKISYGGLGKVATVVTGLLAAAAAALVTLFQALKPPVQPPTP